MLIAMTLKGAYLVSKDFHDKHFINRAMTQPKSPVQELNEFSQKQYGKIPAYKLVAMQGEPHLPMLEYSLTMPDGSITTAIGANKRQAKTTLASNKLESL